MARRGNRNSQPGTKKAASLHKPVILFWHTTDILEDPCCMRVESIANQQTREKSPRLNFLVNGECFLHQVQDNEPRIYFSSSTTVVVRAWYHTTATAVKTKT